MAYINPFKASKKWYCFSCGQEFYLGWCAIGNWRTGQVLSEAPSGWWNRFCARFLVETLDGPFYVRNFASRKCPHCQEFLPPNMETARNIIIAVLGDITVGKTHYIAACIEQINPGGPMHHLEEVVECQALNQEAAQKFHSTLYEPLFTNLTSFKGTLPMELRKPEERLNEPLIYTLTIRKAQLQKTYNLIFYDASGEDLRDQQTLVDYKSYALDPDAIIYIADPLTIPGIESRTPYKKQSKLPPDYILRWTIDLVKPYKRLRGTALNIPIAITLSKSDLLEYVEPSDTPFRFLGEPNYADGLDMDEIEVVDKEVKDLLRKYGAYSLLDAQRLSEHVSFFATSATGCALDPDTGKFPYVKPRRCLDPLLWILFQLGVISAKGDKPSQGH
jgi:hypothetical protein